MNQSERQQLHSIIEDLTEAQREAPTTAVYRGGRTGGSVAMQLQLVIDRLQKMVGTNEQPEATEED